MVEIDYVWVLVLLFDFVYVNQCMMCYVLFEIGFWQIECVLIFEDLKVGIIDGSLLMIVVESSVIDVDVCCIVCFICCFEFGNNLFVVILLMIWSWDMVYICKVIECGVDDLIVWLFLIMFVEECVCILIKGCKQFIVISDYIGFDWCKNNDCNLSVQIFEVFNLLQVVVEGDMEVFFCGSQWIQEVKLIVFVEWIC